MRFGAIANSARGGPPRPPPVRDRVKILVRPKFWCWCAAAYGEYSENNASQSNLT